MSKLILASSSPARLALLKTIGATPDLVDPADIDETPLKKEKPEQLATRLALQKAQKIAQKYPKDHIIIGSDSVVVCRGLILPKAESIEDVKFCLKKLSGRRHRVYTAVCIIKTGEQFATKQRLSQTIVKFKNLTEQEINNYAILGEGLNKAGGYSIQGYAQSFTPFIRGEVSTVIGLPLFETRNMLISFGLKI